MTLYLDIETAPEYEVLPAGAGYDGYAQFWEKFAAARGLYVPEGDVVADVDALANSYVEHAGLYAEFGQVICIALGYFNDGDTKLRVLQRDGRDEDVLLSEFVEMCKKATMLCAYNGKNFDFPFLARRMLFNRVELPRQLRILHLKPWETQLIDPVDIYRGTQYRHTITHELLCWKLGIKCKTDGLRGSDVGRMYWEGKYEAIGKYAQEDVFSLMQQHQRLVEAFRRD